MNRGGHKEQRLHDGGAGSEMRSPAGLEIIEESKACAGRVNGLIYEWWIETSRRIKQTLIGPIHVRSVRRIPNLMPGRATALSNSRRFIAKMPEVAK